MTTLASTPHRPSYPAPRAPSVPAPRLPMDEVGRHRRIRSRASAVLDTVGQLGSAVSLSALLVLAAAVGGLADGHPADPTPLSITSDPAR